MGKVIWATGANERFLTPAEYCLRSARECPGFDSYVLVTLDCDADPAWLAQMSPWTSARISTDELMGMDSFACLQYGAFTAALRDVEPDDVVVFTDADLRAQRPPTADELEAFRNLQSGEIMMGSNLWDGETLYEEAPFLRPSIGLDALGSRYGSFRLADLKCYNTGVVAATVATWRLLYTMYSEAHQRAEHHRVFDHPARMQWLISYIAETEDSFRVVHLPRRTHLHGIPEVRQDSSYDGKNWRCDGEVALFAHKLDVWLQNESGAISNEEIAPD